MAVQNLAQGPQPPKVTRKQILLQFWRDITGKEVQSAETTSHSWVANQFGHTCIGIVLGAACGVLFGPVLTKVLLCIGIEHHLEFPWDSIVGSAVAAILVVGWEVHAYRVVERRAGGQFPLGRKLLMRNAFVAAAYMVIGVAIALAYRYFTFKTDEWPRVVIGILVFLALVVVGARLAVPWLRQKIIWQKAGLPFLFRLADAPPTMTDEDAQCLQEIIDRVPPPDAAPCQIVVSGPVGVGRTPLCAGIGTEFAFKKAAVRYLSFDELLEFSKPSNGLPFGDDPGPPNIGFWPWYEAQVLIIDDIGPSLGIDDFRQLLEVKLGTIRGVLRRCHTVWVIGDVQGADLTEQFAIAIGQFCFNEKGQKSLLAIELEHGPAQSERPPSKYKLSGSTARAWWVQPK